MAKWIDLAHVFSLSLSLTLDVIVYDVNHIMCRMLFLLRFPLQTLTIGAVDYSSLL